MMNLRVRVVSAMPGSGKTSWAINKMTFEKDTPFIYITPYIDEIDRVRIGCEKVRDDFATPKDMSTKKVRHNMSDDLKELVYAGKSIVASHKLFENISPETVEYIKAHGYTLILDEVMAVVKTVEKDSNRIDMLLKMGVLEIDEDNTDNTDTIKYLVPGPDSTFSEFEHYRVKAALNRLVLSGDSLLMWLFPVSVFKAFKEIWNLTYLFEGSSQHQYYMMNGIEFDFLTVAGNPESGWKLFEYQTGQRLERKEIAKYRDLITIIEDEKMNLIGDDEFTLSSTYYKRRTGELKTKRSDRPNPQMISLIGKRIHNFFRNMMRAKSSECMWTIFKGNKPSKKRRGISYAVDLCNTNGYSTAYTPFNLRATNAYRHVKYLAYCVNVFPHGDLVSFYQSKGFDFDKELYAVSEMVQWLFRSRIRNSQNDDEDRKVVLYIPSERMRGLLKQWLNGSISLQTLGIKGYGT